VNQAGSSKTIAYAFSRSQLAFSRGNYPGICLVNGVRSDNDGFLLAATGSRDIYGRLNEYRGRYLTPTPALYLSLTVRERSTDRSGDEAAG
jgi:hypothetical protein